MDDPTAVKYAAMVWNTPLSPAHADHLFAALRVAQASSLLDLGCGWGELLRRAAQIAAPGCECVGVDSDPALLARAREAAAPRGSTRTTPAVRFVEADATAWAELAEVVFCIGAAHAWGGAPAALRALRDRVLPGGRLLFGDGCWPHAPTPAADAIFGPQVLALEDLHDAARAAGWRVHACSLATLGEWDAFEGSFRAGRERWAATHPEDRRAPAVRAEMTARRTEYEDIYRGVLGFAYLVLAAG